MPTGPVTPSTLLDGLGQEIEFLTEVAEERREAVKLGLVYEQLCSAYRALGICAISGDGDVDGFFHYLLQSALTRRHYLDAVGAVGGGEPRYRRASFIDPTFDAIAARQWRLTRDILARTADAFTAGEEYEDDFCYAEVIRRLAVPPTEMDALTALLARWEAVLEGGADRRLDVAKALIARDPVAFAEMLRALLAAEEAKARDAADPVGGSIRADEVTFFPNRWVSVEGLALLALAEQQGMPVTDAFPTCPPLARSGVFGPFRSKGFPAVVFIKE
jgi:hypothetical protein